MTDEGCLRDENDKVNGVYKKSPAEIISSTGGCGLGTPFAIAQGYSTTIILSSFIFLLSLNEEIASGKERPRNDID